MSDPAQYRTKDELESYKRQDPILSLKTHMLDRKLVTEEQFTEMDKECRAVSEESVKFAEQSPEPSLEELHRDVFA
jgi:pyruvate dehydrogenase E1 component alpha subunit